MLKIGVISAVFIFFIIQNSFAKQIVHVIKEGETLSHIADKYNDPKAEIIKRNNKKTDVVWIGMKLTVEDNSSQVANKAEHGTVKSLAPAVSKKESIKSSNGDLIHTFKEGDTLWSVAKEHGVTGEEIKKLNNKKTDVVWIGMKLKIKEGVVDEAIPKQESKPEEKKEIVKPEGGLIIHVVKEGETLSHISDKYNIPSAEIKKLNNKKTDVVWIGMKLTIPNVQNGAMVSNNEITKKEVVKQAVITKENAKPTCPTTSKSYKKAQHGIEFKHQGDENVYASLSGTVLAIVETIDHLKPVVIIKHGSQTNIYGKLTQVSVKQGDSIKKGQVIGAYGSNGLYFAYRENGEFADSVAFLDGCI